jgi:multisubunit Na+/H+ antiporter MnhB subunit
VVPNKTLSWIGIGFMFTFIALAILGGVDYFIYKKKPLRTAQNFFEYILNNQKAGLFFMALFIVVGLVTAIIDSAQEYRGGALAATGVVLALWLSIFWHQYNKIK